MKYWYILYRAWGFSCGSAGKESICNVGVVGYILGLGRSPGEGKGYLHPVSCMKLENMVNGKKKMQKTVAKDHALHNSIYMNCLKYWTP